MKFPFKGIGFDWAYTLVDLGNEDDIKPMQKVHEFLGNQNLAPPGFEELLAQSRKIFRPMIEDSHRTNQEARFEIVLQKLMNHFGIHLNGEITLKKLLEIYYLEVYSERQVYPEVESVLESLKKMGVRMGVVSNTTNPGFMKRNEMQAVGLNPYFEFAIYSSETPYRKPHPSIFNLAIENLNLNPEEILFVGDNPQMDIVGAQNSGMKSAWLNRGKNPNPIKNEPDYELHSLEDLLKIEFPNQ